MMRGLYEVMMYPDRPLLITGEELGRHLDFILDILPIERAIGVVHEGGFAELISPECLDGTAW